MWQLVVNSRVTMPGSDLAVSFAPTEARVASSKGNGRDEYRDLPPRHRWPSSRRGRDRTRSDAPFGKIEI